MTAEAAATTILDGVRSGTWRILIGRDAATLDSVIRANPEAAYDYDELFKLATEEVAAYRDHRVGQGTGTQLFHSGIGHTPVQRGCNCRREKHGGPCPDDKSQEMRERERE